MSKFDRRRRSTTRTITSLIGGILDDDIRFVVLEISQGKEDNISLIDPHLRCHNLDEKLPRRIQHLTHTFFRIFPRMWANRFSPSKHCASIRPFPNILVTCAYSWPSSRNTSSRLSSSFSFFPRLLFLPPFWAIYCCVDVGWGVTNLSFILWGIVLVLPFKVKAKDQDSYLWHLFFVSCILLLDRYLIVSRVYQSGWSGS